MTVNFEYTHEHTTNSNNVQQQQNTIIVQVL